MKTRITFLIVTTGTLSGVLFSSGCASHEHSDAVKGESVKLSLVETRGERSGLISMVAGSLTGTLIDTVKASLDAESQKLERQFGTSTYRSDFWKITRDAEGRFNIQAEYSGFRLERFTSNYPDKGGVPAMEFECNFELSDNGRLFLIQPTKFVTRESKAKVVNSEGRINSTINIAIDAMWIDKNQTVHNERIALTSFDVMNYSLDEALVLDEQYFGPDTRAGWFPGIPVTVGSPDGKPLWESMWTDSTKEFRDGAFKLSVFVTEKDASEAKQIIERASKFIGDNRDAVVGKVQSAVDKESSK